MRIFGWKFSMWWRDGGPTPRAGEFTAYASRGQQRGEFLTGWWARRDRKDLELIARVSNGEMAGLKLSVTIPLLGWGAIKVRVPRRLVAPWVLEGRDTGLRLGYVGRWVEVMALYEEDHMRRYYIEQRDRGKLGEHVSPRALWKGLYVCVKPRPADRLFGRQEMTETVLREGTVMVPMPEGEYPATYKETRMAWQRPRLPWPSRTREQVTLDLEVPIPFPGKGENSWDCEDDAIFSSSGGRSVPDAVGDLVASVLRRRMQYGGMGWTPDKGWPDRVITR